MRRSTTFARIFREQGKKTAVKRLQKRVWAYPLAIEVKYAKALTKFLDASWRKYADSYVSMLLPGRSDALDDIQPENAIRQPALGAIATLAEDIDKFNSQEWAAFQKIAVGSAFSSDELWVKPVIDNWVNTQVSLITKADNDMHQAVARRVREGVRNGWSNEDTKAMIYREMPGISMRRARIIARDQTSKLNSDLSQGRMQNAGLETYIWSTSMDERVRGLPGGRYPRALPSHYAMEGKICRWDDPTKMRSADGEWVPRPMDAPTTHPGHDILCRCVALPNWAELDELTDATPEERYLTEVEMAEDALARATTAASYLPDDSKAKEAFIKDQLAAQSVLAKLLQASQKISETKQTGVMTAEALKGVIGLGKDIVASGAVPADGWQALVERFNGMPEEQRKAYETMLGEWLQSFGSYSDSKSYYMPGSKKICISRAAIASMTKTGCETFLHEMGHGVDFFVGDKFRDRLDPALRALTRSRQLGLGAKVSKTLNGIIDETRNKVKSDIAAAIRASLAARGMSLEKFRELVAESYQQLLAWSPETSLQKFIVHLDATDTVSAGMLSFLLPYRWHLSKTDLGQLLRLKSDEKMVETLAAKLEALVYKDNSAAWLRKVADEGKTKLSELFSDLETMAPGDVGLRRGISDMFSGATRNRFSFGWVHSNSYWKGGLESLDTESVADIAPALTTPGGRAVLDKWMPDEKAIVLRIFKEAAK